VIIEGLDHVQVAAPDGCETDAQRFYGELLGLVEIDKPASLAERGGVWFRCGSQQLHVGVDHPFEPARKAHPALRVRGHDRLRGLAGNLQRASVEVRWDDSIPGQDRFYVSDPWGNRLEILAG
jgi:catechol 2,3-dioxygenase-like lactoylglutathione lyase family enzyme